MQANAKSRFSTAWIIGLAMLCLLATQAYAATSITSINVINKSDRVVVSVQGSAPLKMAPIRSTIGRFLAFQFQGQMTCKGRLIGVHSGRIFNVRYSRFQEDPPAMRVVLNTSSRLDYSTDWNADRTQVQISIWKFGANRSAAAPEKSEPVAQVAEIPDADIMPILPPAAMREPQGSEPGKIVQPAQVKVTAKPMKVVRTTAPAVPQPMRVAQVLSTPAAEGPGKRVSLNFLAADIDDVLKALAVQSGENIVVGNDVNGTITVTLDGVTVDEALDYITQLSGLTYVKDQHTYLVGSSDSVGGLAKAKVAIVTLLYANADDVLEMLKVQCPQTRASKISVRGGLARKHEQTFEQGKLKSDASGQANINSQGQANVNASGQAEGNAQGKNNGDNKSASGSANVNASGGASGQSSNNAQGSMNINAKRGQESLASMTSIDSPTSNMIALVGSDEKIAAAKKFIANIEEAMKSQTADKKISVYNVKYVNTQELANTIMSMVLGVTVTLAPCAETDPISAGMGLKIVPTNLLSGEKSERAFDTEKTAFSHTLIIVGKADDVQKAMDTAVQFDVPGETDLLAYKVKYVDTDLLAKTLRQLVPAVYVEGLGITHDDKDASAGSSKTDTATTATQAGSGDKGTESQVMSAAALNNLSRTLVITGRKGDVEKAKKLLEALDVKSPQIKIEAKITSLTETGEKKLGLDWTWGKLSVVEDFTAPLIVNDKTLGTDVAISPNVSVNKSLNRYWRQPLNFGATLDALITNGDGKLLAAPSLVCLEGKPGQFFVGDTIRFVTQVSVASNGEPTVTTDTANVGVQLSVVGSVSSDGFITLNLHPEVSVVRMDEVKTSGVALTLPTISRRFTDHVVRVKDGSTITIGGLINDQEVKTMTKLPLLGDLPVLGQLFRHTNKTKDHSEVVIFITASIVND